ncbi:RidA family protein [Agrobacterium tumefaciens]|uniref:RidA family protein n=1 Tax=Agrobacterium tumefaciens TaxID=358 RepID=UPI003BA17934
MARQIIQVPADSTLFGAHGETFDRFGYAPAVKAGGLLFISGQIALRADGSCPEDIKEQVDIVFQRTIEILRWNGLTEDDLVEIYSYHVDLPNNFGQFVEVKNRYLTSNFPAWTALGIAALGLPELKIEMRSIAAFRE